LTGIACSVSGTADPLTTRVFQLRQKRMMAYTPISI